MSARSGEPLLQVAGLHVAYGKAEVVHGVDFEVRSGEFVVMLGRNGAGKSTILHAVSGLIPKRAGTVRF
jgi:branched-chain amino acid transport system ATP-binding protein